MKALTFHLNDLPPDDTLNLEGDLDPDFLLADAKNEEFTQSVHFNLTAQRTLEGEIIVTGEIDTPMKIRCVRCWEMFHWTQSIADFACVIEESELDESLTIDLTEPLREEIFLQLPNYPRCDELSGRQCPGVEAIEAQNQRPFPGVDGESSEKSEGGEAGRKEDKWGALDALRLRAEDE